MNVVKVALREPPSSIFTALFRDAFCKRCKRSCWCSLRENVCGEQTKQTQTTSNTVYLMGLLLKIFILDGKQPLCSFTFEIFAAAAITVKS